MQKLGQIQAYSRLQEGEDALFVHPQGNSENSRLIKLRILAETAVRFFIVPVEYDYEIGVVTEHYDDPDFTLFLTSVDPGFEEVEFFYRGSFCLRVAGGNVSLDTYDNTALNIESADPTSFARLWEREERDPRILEIEQAARHNQMLLQRQMEADRAAFRAEMEQMRQEAKTNVTPASSPPAVTPASPPAESASVPPASSSEDGGPAGG